MIRRTRSIALVLTSLVFLLVWGVEANAEDRTFLLIPTIPGESTDAAHATWIDAYAIDAGAISVIGGGGGGERRHQLQGRVHP